MSFIPLALHFHRDLGGPRSRCRVPLLKVCVVLPLFVLLSAGSALAATGSPGRADELCPRPAEGAVVQSPPELRSHHGVLEVSLHFKYQATFAGQGPPRYCYVTDDGLESPTLRLHPGDRLIIHFHNDLAPAGPGLPADQSTVMNDCAAMAMTASMTNLHFHGLTVPPTCHQDDVIRTAIPAGKEFEYRLTIPADEPPGLYWYHPHPHGYTERQVQGGAAGALIVEGIERAVPAVRTLPQRVLVLRDQNLTDVRFHNPDTPAWDLSVNYVPILYPQYRPAIIQTKPSQRELWRVVNGGGDTILNLQLLVKGAPQTVQLVAIDGVPLARGTSESQSTTNIELPPGARVEFIVSAPAVGEQAELVTTKWDTGIEGDSDPARPIATVVSSNDAPEPAAPAKEKVLPWRGSVTRGGTQQHVERRLYFSQFSPNPAEGDTSVFYFLTVAGNKPQAYRMGQEPNIVLHQGDLEDWIVENRAQEDHVFHMHQLHFRVLEVDGKPVNDPATRDTFNLPHWDGSGPYPSVKLRMDFRDPNAIGTSLYHCHILKHEDMGMMGVIQVLPPGIATDTSISGPSTRVDVATKINIVAYVRGHGSHGATPGGTVQFMIDGIPSGRPIAISEGKAVFTTSFDSDGTHRITATYSGDQHYDESIARPLQIVVSGV